MSLNRRQVILLAASASWVLGSALAHHGWSSFDQSRPLYLEGVVVTSKWQNPHAELTIDVPPGLKLPAGLTARRVPAQSAAVDGPSILGKASLPRRADKRWVLELAPLTRLEAWKVAEVRPGAKISVVGYTSPGEQGEAVLRVEYLFVGDQVYGLRSSPA